MSRFPYFACIFTFLIVFNSCDSSRKDHTVLSDKYKNLISGHTQGVISSKGPIRVNFAEAVYEPGADKPELNKNIISTDPHIEGEWEWSNPYTIEMIPGSDLSRGQHYTVFLDLAGLFPDLPGDSSRFSFSFDVIYQDFQWSLGNVKPETENFTMQVIGGTIQLADAADQDEVESMLAVGPSMSFDQVQWFHAINGLRHEFEIQGIPRKEQEYDLVISLNGDPIGVERSVSATRTIPAIGDFSLLDASVPADDRNSFILTFSDPVDPDQELTGLIRLLEYTGDMRYQIDQNQIQVFITGNNSGSFDLRVNAGIRSALGGELGKIYERTLIFEDIKPAVRLEGSGNIIPGKGPLHFPFSAVNLNAVQVEVFKVFNNNISQFYQGSQLDNTWYDYQVGRVVKRKRVVLNSLNPEENSNKWVSYGLDLSEIIDQDPNAIYQVSIGFFPEDAILSCSTDWSKFGYDIDQSQQKEQSIWDSYYGPAGYYRNYNWNDRNDPCTPAYYNPDRFVRTNVFRSRLGLIAKVTNNDRYACIVTDLETAQPVSGVTIKLLDYQQQVIGETNTDSDGIAWIDADREGFLFIAQKGNDKGFLEIRNEAPLSMSEFDVDGITVKEGMKGFLYAERGVWRPGDSIYLNFILRDQSDPLPPDYPVTMKLFDPRNRLHTSYTRTKAIQGIYPLHCATGPDDPTGTWRVVAETGTASFVKYLMVETVKPNRLKIEVDLGKDRLEPEDDRITGDIKANWLHGTPAAGLKARVEMQIKSIRADFEGFNQYEFNDPLKPGVLDPKIIFDGELDGSGLVRFGSEPIDRSSLAGVSSVVLKARVFEKGGNESFDQFSIPYYPFPAYTGIKIPEDRYGSQRLKVDEENSIEYVVVDAQGIPQSDRSVQISLFRLDWKWWYERDLGMNSSFNIRSHADLIETMEMTTNRNGKGNYLVAPTDYGRYYVRICDPVSGHCSGDFFYAGYPWYQTDYGKKDAASVLSFTSGKKSYTIGEEAILLVPAAEGSRIHVSLENGTDVVRSFWVNGEKGETRIPFKVTKEMMPGIYAHIHLIQPHGQRTNDLPIRLYGVQAIRVEDPSTHLIPQVVLAPSLEPEESFQVNVSEENGESMAYTIAIVDEGLLSLTRYSTPDPWDYFYAKEALGVKTWDLYKYVMDAVEGHFDRVVSIGGDAARLDRVEEERANRFKPVVMHAGPFELEKGKTSTHAFTMPNYIGAVRVMVVAASGKAYGSTEKEVKVKKPLMVLPTAPRVLNPGNKVRIPVNVFVMEDNVRSVNVKIAASQDYIDVISSNTKTVRFNEPGEKMAYFDILVKEKTGIANIRISAQSGGLSSSQDVDIQVLNPNPFETDIQEKVVSGGSNWSTEVVAIGMDGTNSAVLEVSDIPPIELEHRLNYLIRYPYGCIEQTTSAVFAQLYLDNFVDLSTKQSNEIQRNVRAAIERLKRFQLSNGGFVYWPGNNDISPWGTNYVGHFLIEAKQNGYFVPGNMISSWITFQKKAVNDWSTDNYAAGWSARSRILDQVYRLYCLALAGSPEIGAMNRMRNLPELQGTAKMRLAAAYALAGRKEVAKRMIENLDLTVSPYRELSYTYGSHVRDMGMNLESLVIIGELEEGFTHLMDLVETLNQGSGWSTQSLAYALIGVARYCETGMEQGPMSFICRVTGEDPVQIASDKPVFQLEIPIETADKISITLENKGRSSVFARVISEGQPVTGSEKTTNNDLRMEIDYVDMDGQSLDVTQLIQGTDFVARVNIRHPDTRKINYEEMALSQVFPPGWEIVNTRIENLSRFGQNATFHYQDIRDDRIYTHFNLNRNSKKTYYVMLNAAYEGTYYLPAVRCEAMYDNTIFAQTAGREVKVLARDSD